jgi:uroporphyrinogen decarboxylase
MVCSGINEPARSEFDIYLREMRGTTLQQLEFDAIDIVTVSPHYIGPKRKPGEDMWGVIRTPVRNRLGSYDEISYYPLADVADAEQIEHLDWPSPDWFDYSVIPRRIRALLSERERAIMVTNGNIFESSWYMRGFEQMFTDFVLNPELANAILEKVRSFYVEFFSRVLESGNGEIDLVFTADDLGGQNGLLMSRNMWEQFIKPHHVALNRVIHEFDAMVIYHTDGAVMEVVDGLVDMGIDILQALQFDADGMSPEVLKERYGHKLCFEGGVSVQHTLPHLEPADVRAEVEHLVEVLGASGGYILGPSHAIQAGTPPENIAAMFDTVLGFPAT